MDTTTTFSQLDGKIGTTQQAECALSEWYDSVKDTPIGDMPVEDLARAIRQEIHLAYVIPAALRALDSDPLAGHLYDGELMSAVSKVPWRFWNEHSALRCQTMELLKQSRALFDNALQREMDAFLRAGE